MNAYFLSLLGAALLAALIGMLSPEGGIGKTLRLLTSLVLICVIAAPLPGLIAKLSEIPDSIQEEQQLDFSEQSQAALDAASRSYFARALTAHLEEKFNIPQGEIYCIISWSELENETKPKHITLILSGSAKWKNPQTMQSYVSELLGCSCDSAID